MGGGYSILSRKFGMGVDAVLGFKIVTADGSLLTADATQNTDLFWALRGGGGGSFGVVVEVTLRIFPVPPKVTLVRFEWTDGAKALPVWEQFLANNLNNKNLIPQGFFNFKGTARANVFYLGSLADANALLRPLAAAGVTASRTEKEVDWMNIVHQFAGCKDPAVVGANHPSSCLSYAFTTPLVHPKTANPQEKQAPWVATSAYIDKPIGAAKWAQIIAKIKTLPGIIVIADPAGGSINEIASDATSYVHRDKLYHLQIMGYFEAEAARAGRQAAIEGFYNFLVDLGVVSGMYINYPNNYMLNKPNWGTLYYGQAGFQRLVQIKAKYDPTNRFRHPFSIPVNGVSGGTAQPPSTPSVLVTPSAPSGVVADVSIGACGSGQSRTFNLVEVASGSRTALETRVTACSRDGSLVTTFDIQELNSQPQYRGTACNDDVNPPYKSNAVEMFLGFAPSQAALFNYLEVEANPAGNLWIAKIQLNAAGKMVKSEHIDCAASGISVKFSPGASPSWFRYELVIPFSILPGFSLVDMSAQRLFGTFLRIAHVDTSFSKPKELQAFRSHGIRNFHQPSKFASISVPTAFLQGRSGAPSSGAGNTVVAPPRVDSGNNGGQCVTDDARLKQAQTILIQKGLLAGRADGLWGRGSKGALAAWLQRNQLPPPPESGCITESVFQVLSALRN